MPRLSSVCCAPSPTVANLGQSRRLIITCICAAASPAFPVIDRLRNSVDSLTQPLSHQILRDALGSTNVPCLRSTPVPVIPLLFQGTTEPPWTLNPLRMLFCLVHQKAFRYPIIAHATYLPPNRRPRFANPNSIIFQNFDLSSSILSIHLFFIH
jgi:hypothetical protein